MGSLGSFKDGFALPGDLLPVTMVALMGGEEVDAAVMVLKVIPLHEFSAPVTRLLKVRKPVGRVERAVLARSEQAFRIGVVVADMGPAKGWFNAQGLQFCKHGKALHGRSVVAMQNQRFRCDAFCKGGTCNQRFRMLASLFFPDFPAHNEAAENVYDHVEEEEGTLDGAVHVGDIPRPDLIGL